MNYGKSMFGFNNKKNQNYLTETDFSIVPEGIIIWDGELPFKPGSRFPTSDIQERANVYLTNEKLYKGEFEGIYDDIFGLNDYLRDVLTNNQVLKLIPNLPEHPVITETWVDLLSPVFPQIDGSDTDKISKVSTLLDASNSYSAYRSAIRGSLFMYGVAPFRVDRQSGGNVKIIDMPVKNWIPFVNENDTSTIDVNCFFNIFTHPKDLYFEDEDILIYRNTKLCEFILYHEDGLIERYLYYYDNYNYTLGDLILKQESQAFNGKGVSPIVVFTGNKIGNTVYGEDAYKRWDAAIASVMRAYGVILMLLERSKEIIRVVPEGATQRDEHTGTTYLQQTGAISYKNNDNKAPDVKFVIPEIPMEEAIKAYKEAITRLSRDTDLSYTIFDTKEMGSQMSAKALQTTMFKTDKRAKALSALMVHPTKQLISKIALAGGIDLGLEEFSVKPIGNIVRDVETEVDIVQKRNGGAVTLSREESIVIVDGVSSADARSKVRVLDGLPPEEMLETSSTESGEDSMVSSISPTHVSKTDTDEAKDTDSMQISLYGGVDIHG